jgi:hypothetical protein
MDIANQECGKKNKNMLKKSILRNLRKSRRKKIKVAKTKKSLFFLEQN